MLYISTKKINKIGVTDTDDMVEELYTKAELRRIISNKAITNNIFGLRGTLDKPEYYPITIDKPINKKEFICLISEYKNSKNDFDQRRLADLFASAVVGSVLQIDWKGAASNGIKQHKLVLKKIDYDRWNTKCDSPELNNRSFDNRMIVSAVFATCVYYDMLNVNIQ